MVEKAYARYAQAAVVLGFSVQVAAMVLIIRKLFGISGLNFGSLTVEVTWAAALLSILPLPLAYLVPSDLLQQQGRDADSPQQAHKEPEEPRDLLLLWTTPAWVLFLFTFACRMTSYYSIGQVGGVGTGQVTSGGEAQNIKELCFRRYSVIPPKEQLAFDIFALGGSLFVCLVFLGMLIDGVAKRGRSGRRGSIHKSSLSAKLNTTAARVILILNILLWGTPQVYTIFRFRKIQSTLARSINMVNDDNQWSFGQIMAVVVFLPVVMQCIYELANWSVVEDNPVHVTVGSSNSQKTV